MKAILREVMTLEAILLASVGLLLVEEVDMISQYQMVLIQRLSLVEIVLLGPDLETIL